MHWWRVVRPVLALAIVVGVAWHLTRLIQTTDLRSLADHWRGDRIATSAGLYVVAIVCWGMYFARLVRRYEPGPLAPILRAYLISHVGKYVPGRALVMVVRSAIAYQWNVPVVISVAMTVYETLVSMAGGALVAAGLASLLDGAALGRALILFAIAAVPIIPGFFDRLALRAMRRFLPAGHAPPPRLTFRQLLEGLLWAAAGWFFLGLALAQLLAGVLADPPGFSPHTIGSLVGIYALAHVSGFLALPVPGGLGVREAVLQKMLVLLPVTSMIDAGAAAAAALLFRAVQVVADVALALVLYPWELVARGRR